MLQELIRFHKNPTVDFIIKLLVSALAICLLGPLVIEIRDEMPITMQTFIILLCAILFGWKVGALATIVYILCGALGLPVFSDYHSGIDVVFGPHGGFFFGFIFAAIISGYLASLEPFNKSLAIILLWLVGHGIILLAVFLWFAPFSPNWVEILQRLAMGALIKSAIGALLVQLILRYLKGRSGYYTRG